MIARLLHSEPGFCGRRALCLHLQLDLGDLEAPALDAELQLVAGVMQTSSNDPGVFLEMRGRVISLISALMESAFATDMPRRLLLLVDVVAKSTSSAKSDVPGLCARLHGTRGRGRRTRIRLFVWGRHSRLQLSSPRLDPRQMRAPWRCPSLPVGTSALISKMSKRVFLTGRVVHARRRRIRYARSRRLRDLGLIKIAPFDADP